MTTAVKTPLIQDKTILALRKEIERKHGKTPEQLYDEREKRVRDAVELREGDRIPINANSDALKRAGLKNSAQYYDPVAYKNALRQAVLDFEPDRAMAGFASSGAAMEALDVKNRMWPGGNLPDDYEYQFIEGEYMKADEYDLFLTNPTDFFIRCYLPRVYGVMAPLAKLPPLDLSFMGFEGLTAIFDSPEYRKMARALAKAGRATKEFRELTGNASAEMELLGFPAFSSMGAVSISGAPFDAISSSLRGMTGSMLDMYRQPDKLLEACDVMLERRIARSLPADPKKRGNPKIIGMPLWRGDRAFMSDEQFKKFYWPGLKKAMLAVINLGYVPNPFFEAYFGDRLECLLELPKGKFIASVDYSDVVRAREILKGHACVSGGGPHSLRVCSLREIEKFYKHLIDVCGKGGGFILNMGLPSDCKLEDAQALVNSIKEYARF